MKKTFFILLFSLIISVSVFSKTSFEIVALGVNGGVIDGNITSYLIRSTDENNYLALDAGTLLPGIEKAVSKGAFKNINIPSDSTLTPEGYIFKNSVKGYFISHGHLDHISGLVISSTDDSKKNIYALQSTVNVLTDHYFNWKTWPNFSTSGEGFKLGQYTYKVLEPGKETAVEGTSLYGAALPLSHSNYESSMILVRKNKDYFAFFGDTGPDTVEKSTHLDTVWKTLGPKVKNKSLKGIIIEVSYPNGIEDKNLFGHLTPDWLIKELQNLEKYSGGKGSLKGLNVIISHVKPTLNKNTNVRSVILEQLKNGNTPGVNFIMLDQGDSMEF
jgi:3',5'-cyclic-nucleotide phosphodiesterase